MSRPASSPTQSENGAPAHSTDLNSALKIVDKLPLSLPISKDEILIVFEMLGDDLDALFVP